MLLFHSTEMYDLLFDRNIRLSIPADGAVNVHGAFVSPETTMVYVVGNNAFLIVPVAMLNGTGWLCFDAVNLIRDYCRIPTSRWIINA